jgi:hypothetical protein
MILSGGNMTARRKWCIGLLAVVVAAVCLFHAPLLRRLTGLLIVDQPTDDYDCVCIISWGHFASGDRCYDVAAELYRRKPSCRLLIVAPNPNRLEEAAIMPSFESMSRRELLARHVPREAVSVVYAKPWNNWSTARALAGWMSDHPGKRLLVLSGQFSSGRTRRAVDDVLEPDAAALLHVRALRSRDFDDTNWWHYRAGYRAFGESWLLRSLSRADSGHAGKTLSKSADQYEREFLRACQEKTP